MEKGTLLPNRTSLPSYKPRLEREERCRVIVVDGWILVICSDGAYDVDTGAIVWITQDGAGDDASHDEADRRTEEKATLFNIVAA